MLKKKKRDSERHEASPAREHSIHERLDILLREGELVHRVDLLLRREHCQGREVSIDVQRDLQDRLRGPFRPCEGEGKLPEVSRDICEVIEVFGSSLRARVEDMREEENGAELLGAADGLE